MTRTDAHVVPATQELIDKLKGRLRGDDERECYAMMGISADEGLQKGFDKSLLVWVGLLDGVPFNCFGVTSTSTLNYKGIPWMLGTDAIQHVKKEVKLQSRFYVRRMLSHFEILENWVDTRNKVSIAWLDWCGFTVEAPEIYGFEKKLFHRFWMKKGV